VENKERGLCVKPLRASRYLFRGKIPFVKGRDAQKRPFLGLSRLYPTQDTPEAEKAENRAPTAILAK